MFSIFLKNKHEVEYKGEILEYNDSFDTILKVFLLSKDKEATDVDKITISISLLFGEEIAKSLPIEKQFELYCLVAEDLNGSKEQGHSELLTDIEGNVIPVELIAEEEHERLVSFTQDSEEIFSSFLQQYGIDLIEQQGKLSYCKFIALLRNIGEDTPLGKLEKIRSYKPDTETKNYDLEMKKLQSIVAIRNDEL